MYFPLQVTQTLNTEIFTHELLGMHLEYQEWKKHFFKKQICRFLPQKQEI